MQSGANLIQGRGWQGRPARHAPSALLRPSLSCSGRHRRGPIMPPGGDRFGVSASSVSRWRGMERSRATPAREPRGGDRPGADRAHAELILARWRQLPDIAMRSCGAAWPDNGLRRLSTIRASSPATRSHAKKDGACQRAGPARHLETARGLVRGPARSRSRTLVFIDETWAPPTWPAYGRGPRGQRLRAGSAAWPLEDDDLGRRTDARAA